MDKQAPKGPVNKQAPKGPVNKQAPKGPVNKQAPKGPVNKQAPEKTVDEQTPEGLGDKQASEKTVDEQIQKQLLTEYEILRDEIRAADTQNYQILAALIGASAVIFVNAFNQDDPAMRFFTFMSLYIITIPGYGILRGNRSRTWRISTYMRVFLEPCLTGINWETRLDSQRSKVKKAGCLTRILGEHPMQLLSSRIGTNEFFVVSSINVVALAAASYSGLRLINSCASIQAFLTAILGGWFQYSTCGDVKWFLFKVLVGCLCILTLYNLFQEIWLRRGNKTEKRFYEFWDKVQNTEREL